MLSTEQYFISVDIIIAFIFKMEEMSLRKVELLVQLISEWVGCRSRQSIIESQLVAMETSQVPDTNGSENDNFECGHLK